MAKKVLLNKAPLVACLKKLIKESKGDLRKAKSGGDYARAHWLSARKDTVTELLGCLDSGHYDELPK